MTPRREISDPLVSNRKAPISSRSPSIFTGGNLKPTNVSVADQSFLSISTHTDNSGNYVLNESALANSCNSTFFSTTVCANDGISSQCVPVSVTLNGAGASVLTDFTLASCQDFSVAVQIFGSVKSTLGAALPNVSVAGQSGSPSTFTDSAGNYTLDESAIANSCNATSFSTTICANNGVSSQCSPVNVTLNGTGSSVLLDFTLSAALSQEYFQVGNTLFYSSGQGRYCGFSSPTLLKAFSGPNGEHITFLNSIPSGMINDGICVVPANFFFYNNTGYFVSNNNYCGFSNYQTFLDWGGGAVSVPVIHELPTAFHSNGICTGTGPYLPHEFFIALSPAGFSTVYYTTGGGHYCGFPSFASYLNFGGPTSTAGLPNIGTLPNLMISDGICTVPSFSYFFANGTGYFTSGNLHYCGFPSWTSYINHGGPNPPTPSNASFINEIPANFINDGICP